MASITLTVPVGLVETIHDEFVRYRDVQFDVLKAPPRRDRVAAQIRAANLICAIDIVLHPVRWDDLRPDQSTALTADHGLWLDIVYGALLGAADRLLAACLRSAAEASGREAVATWSADVEALLALHAHVDPAR